MTNSKTSFLLIISLAAALLALFLTINSVSQSVGGSVEMKLVLASTGRPKVGEMTKMDLIFKNNSQGLLSFDIFLLFNPLTVRIDQIEGGNVFSDYPRRVVENFSSRLIISGAQFNNVSVKSSRGILASIYFTPLSTGKINFDFLIDNAKYTNIINEDGKNILKKVENFEIEVLE